MIRALNVHAKILVQDSDGQIHAGEKFGVKVYINMKNWL